MNLTTSRWVDAVLDPKDQDTIWDIYVSAFTAHRLHAVAEQMVYDRASLDASLIDTDVMKLLVERNGQIDGFCFLTNNLDKARVNYVNPDYFAQTYPDDFKNGAFHYCTVLAVHPQAQGSDGLFQLVIDEVADRVVSLNGRILFDCSSNVNKWLPDAIKRAMERALTKRGLPANEVSYRTLGSQDYILMDLSKKP